MLDDIFGADLQTGWLRGTGVFSVRFEWIRLELRVCTTRSRVEGGLGVRW